MLPFARSKKKKKNKSPWLLALFRCDMRTVAKDNRNILRIFYIYVRELLRQLPVPFKVLLVII